MRIGIDLGGTKIELVVLDDSGAVNRRERIHTPQGDYAGTIRSIVQLVSNAEAEFKQVMSVGIGTPGAMSPSSGLLQNSNSVCLNNKPFLEDLQQAMNRKIGLANDADCFALSEAIDGAGRDAAVVFGVIIGTGVGGGIVVNKQLLSGPNKIAGEWGHNPLPWPNKDELPGHDCYCGKHGCIETFLSGAGLVLAYDNISGNNISAPEIVRLAEQDKAQAEQALHLYENRLAKSLAQVINILDPDVIVLGGGMSNIERLYINVPKMWGEYVFSDVVRTKLNQAVHGDSGGVRGAAWLLGGSDTDRLC